MTKDQQLVLYISPLHEYLAAFSPSITREWLKWDSPAQSFLQSVGFQLLPILPYGEYLFSNFLDVPGAPGNKGDSLRHETPCITTSPTRRKLYIGYCPPAPVKCWCRGLGGVLPRKKICILLDILSYNAWHRYYLNCHWHGEYWCGMDHEGLSRERWNQNDRIICIANRKDKKGIGERE